MHKIVNFFRKITRWSKYGFTFLRYFYLKNEINKIKIDKHRSCVVLGNGPSLKETLNKHLNFLKNNDLLCVNNFVTSEYYDELRPRFYVLADPDYWENIKTQVTNDQVTHTLDELCKKTRWEMILFVPLQSRNSQVFEKLSKANKCIKVCYYPVNPIPLPFKAIKHFFYRHNFGMPKPQTVLIAGIFVALNMKFKKIFIVGADHSWHERFYVDKNNIPHWQNPYFCDKTKKLKSAPLVKNIGTGETWKIHEQFFSLSLAFKSHVQLEEYSKYLKKKIYNASEKSYIDAYERYNLK